MALLIHSGTAAVDLNGQQVSDPVQAEVEHELKLQTGDTEEVIEAIDEELVRDRAPVRDPHRSVTIRQATKRLERAARLAAAREQNEDLEFPFNEATTAYVPTVMTASSATHTRTYRSGNG